MNEIRQYIYVEKNIPLLQQKRPYASEYIHSISKRSLIYWQKIPHPNYLQKGDIIFLKGRYPGTNHCMIVKKPLSITANESLIQVVDSTQMPHRNDTRTSQKTGLGTGEISILLSKKNQWRLYQNRGRPIELDIYLARVRE